MSWVALRRSDYECGGPELGEVAAEALKAQKADSLLDDPDRRGDCPGIADHRLLPDRSLKVVETGKLERAHVDTCDLAFVQRLVSC